METPLLIATAVIGLGAVVVICLLVRMIATGDYSLILKEREETSLSPNNIIPETRNASDAPALAVPKWREAPMLGLAWVVHFVHELPEWRNKVERKKAAEDLAAIRKRHSPESREN